MRLNPVRSAALASVRFMINVSILDGTPNFEIKFSAANTNALHDIRHIEQHLKELKVKGRMLTFCMRQWSYWRQKVEAQGMDIEAVFRLEIGTASIGEYSQDWTVAFMKGVLRDAAALAALNTKSPRPPEPVEELIALSI